MIDDKTVTRNLFKNDLFMSDLVSFHQRFHCIELLTYSYELYS